MKSPTAMTDISALLHTSAVSMAVTERVVERIKKHSSSGLAKTDRLPVVLLMTGSFCPIHRMHIELLKETKKWLNKKRDEFKMEVVAALISPLHDHYVFSKLGSAFIPATHRVKMCELAIREAGCTDWIFVDTWMSDQRWFVDYPDALRYQTIQLNLSAINALHAMNPDLYPPPVPFITSMVAAISNPSSTNLLEQQTSTPTPNPPQSSQTPTKSSTTSGKKNKKAKRAATSTSSHNSQSTNGTHKAQKGNVTTTTPQAPIIRVLYTCGADQAIKTGLYSLSNGEAIVMGRSQWSMYLQQRDVFLERRSAIIVDRELKNVRSQQIRDMLSHGENVDELTFVAVANYMRVNNLHLVHTPPENVESKPTDKEGNGESLDNSNSNTTAEKENTTEDGETKETNEASNKEEAISSAAPADEEKQDEKQPTTQTETVVDDEAATNGSTIPVTSSDEAPSDDKKPLESTEAEQPTNESS
eukprot:TRINITY_DN11492_c0_g1_i1.p1 TRINITY_DN11492_c0_g1~~TRINITY_DN11492_c0_g1_i1.p1  ORF type:complete len:473 (-),score=127.17 TRINITY_DN11492_c0_g1_i1:57-1475(-)